MLPDFIDHTVSLYQWESYTLSKDLQSQVVVKMFDSEEQEFDQIELLAEWVNLCRKTGPVLVNCQAGLNRSSLVVARALVLAGDFTTSASAVAHMRQVRSPAVLCNPAFEKWVLDHDKSLKCVDCQLKGKCF